MPVDDHPIHPSTQKGADFRYGCWNRGEFTEAYSAPQRRAGANGYQPTFWMERIRIPFRMSRGCKYDMSNDDPNCAGCSRIGQYAAACKSVEEK